MAWTAPTTRIADELIDAADWNTDVQGNQVALRSGSIAIASQAANDFLAAATGSQIGRVAAVANKVPYYSSGSWSFQTLLDLVFPIGFVYVSEVSTNPGTLFGGTWVAFAAGRVTYSLDGTADFLTVEQTGGAKTVTLSTSHLPVHSHTVIDPGHTHQIGSQSSSGQGGSPNDKNNPRNYPAAESRVMQTVTTGITVGNTGGGGAHNNLSPYEVKYMFKRTA